MLYDCNHCNCSTFTTYTCGICKTNELCSSCIVTYMSSSYPYVACSECVLAVHLIKSSLSLEPPKYKHPRRNKDKCVICDNIILIIEKHGRISLHGYNGGICEGSDTIGYSGRIDMDTEKILAKKGWL